MIFIITIDANPSNKGEQEFLEANFAILIPIHFFCIYNNNATVTVNYKEKKSKKTLKYQRSKGWFITETATSDV